MLRSPVLRPATPSDARFIAWGLDEAADGFFASLLGRRSAAILTTLARQQDHAYSHQHAVLADVAGEPAGFCQGFAFGTPDGNGALLRAAGLAALRAGAVTVLGRPLLEALDHHEPGQWYLQAVAVRPQARGTGVGQLLLVDAFDRARRADCGALALDVDVANTRARTLYERLGLVVTATSKPARLLDGAQVHRMVGPVPDR
ncbi:MAG: GNAT family N-acetyltransferase [Candidatus Nanopelagicales bacterium]